MPKVSQEMAESSEIQMDCWLRRFEGIPSHIQNDKSAMKQMRQCYYGMVSYVDDKFGELLDCMEGLGLRDKTAIIFTSDHGEMLGERGFVEKRLFYENSVRVPLIASYPGFWKENITTDVPVSLVDLYPTLADMIGSPIHAPIDGQSLIPLLKGLNKNHQGVVFSEYHGEGVEKPCFMSRKESFKYIMVHKNGRQLFNLENDPDEIHNLAGLELYKDVEESLHSLILNQFDPEAININVRRSQQNCRYIHQAMIVEPKTYWDYAPEYPANKRYCRN
jgi:choline-sulfatase